MERHPASVIDRRMAAMVVGLSINGRGEFWDAHAVACRPELEGEGPCHAGDILLAVQEDLSHLVVCSYEGNDLDHPEAIRAIEDWAAIRANEKAEQLAGIEIAEDGTVAVQRVISTHVEGLRPALGVFWTSDFEEADIGTCPWRKESAPTLLISARVHHTAIDWQVSCMARMDWYSGDCELELRLRPGHRLHSVTAVQWLDEEERYAGDRPVVLPDLDWTT